MSSESHKSNIIILALLGLALLGTIWWVSADHGPGKKPSEQPAMRTTYSANKRALGACYELYEKMGASPGRTNKLLVSHNIDNKDIILILEPIVAITDAETQDLLDWVNQGGLLICTADFIAESYSDPYRIYEETSRTSQSWTCKGPLSRDGSCVDLPDNTVLNFLDEYSPWLSRSREVLLEDGDGERIVEYKKGKGCVIVLAGCSFLSNEDIGNTDNSVLAVDLIAYSLSVARGKRVVFDEFHQGFGKPETSFTVLSNLLITTPTGWAVLALTIAGLAMLVYKGRRFGPRRGPPPRARRNKLEFIRSTASTCRAAKANDMCFVILFRHYRRIWALRAGLDSSASNRQLAEGLEHIGSRQQAEYENILDQGSSIQTGQKLSVNKFNNLIQLLTEIESEIADGNSQS